MQGNNTALQVLTLERKVLSRYLPVVIAMVLEMVVIVIQ